MRTLILLSFIFITVLPGQSAPTAPADDLSKYKTADTLWTHAETLKDALMTSIHGDDEAAVTNNILSLRTALVAFVTQFPQDKQVWDAQLLLVQLNSLARKLKLPNTPSPGESMKILNGILADKSAPSEARAQASFQLIMEAFPERPSDKVDLDALDAKIAAFEKEFSDFSLDGREPAVFALRQNEMMVFKVAGDDAKYLALLKTLESDPHPELVELAQRAEVQVKKVAELKTKPIDLSYTAVDGRKVDLAQMRGKVILIDFWATWCPPCVAGMPQVIAAYKKYHDQGFEIVGVSLDEDKDDLIAFTKEKGMPWPQYFDGLRFDNKVSSSFGIQMIPSMWLIDKKGLLVKADFTGDLDAEIEKQLKAP